MRKLVLFFIIFFHISVFAQDTGTEAMYNEILSLYPPELTSHLPSEINENNLMFIGLESPKGHYLSFVHLVMYYNKEQLAEILSQFEIENMKQSSFTDDCHNVIEYNSDLYTNFSFKIKQCDNQVDSSPIPNFEFLGRMYLPQAFYEDIRIYVLDAKKGRFLSDDKLTKKGVGLGKEWEHGYSRGILVSGNIVTYWLEVW